MPTANEPRKVGDFANFEAWRSRKSGPFQQRSIEGSITSGGKGTCSILPVSLMSSAITRKLFTIDDCYKMAEVGILSPDERTELINGEILVVPPPGPRHGFVVDSVE